ncbi:MAG: hypothetical protein R6V27_01430 [Balneolaceae bacterium]
MQKTAVSLLLFLIVLACGITTAFAQQTEEQTRQNLLPEIDPQDIEIRSQFQARFPGLRRQPILGFNPTPRVYQIDPERTPFIETEEAIAASVPVGQLNRPDAPDYTPLSYSNPTNGFARLGIGSFVSPEADVYAIKGFGNRNWVSGNLSHRSSNGHLDDLDSSFRELDATVRSRLRMGSRSSLKLNAGTFSDFNYLPADETDFVPANTAGGKSSVYGIRGGGEFTFNRTSVTGFHTTFDLFGHNFEMSETSGETLPGEASEWGATARAGYTWAGPRTEELFTAYADVDAGAIDLIGQPSESRSIIEAGASYKRLLNYQTDINASIGIAQVSDALSSSTIYIVPEVDARHTIFDGLDLRVRAAGTPEHLSFKEFREINSFTGLTDPVTHQYTSELRGEVIAEPLSGTMFTAGTSFRHVRNHAYFTRSEQESEISPGEFSTTRFAYSPNFENANFLKLYASFSQQLSAEKFWVSADAFWQRPRLSGNEKIPYTESFGVNGTVSFRPIRDLVLEGWADYSASRFNPTGENLDPYFLLGARFELSLAGNAGIYAKLLNINDVNYEIWQGYSERGFQAFVGITYLF